MSSFMGSTPSVGIDMSEMEESSALLRDGKNGHATKLRKPTPSVYGSFHRRTSSLAIKAAELTAVEPYSSQSPTQLVHLDGNSHPGSDVDGSISEWQPVFSQKDIDGEKGSGRDSWALLAMRQFMPVLIVSVLNFMIGIPFGAAYFPVGWSSTNDSVGDDDDVRGAFPLPGKEALGIRMYLFSTAAAQGVFAYFSKFNNCIGLQMVENVPFCIELAHIVISEQGYGMEALSTLFFLFGASSLMVGLVFYLLGRLELGRIVYLFPRHVLVGCIGGIGAFIIVTAIEVTTNTTFSFSLEEIQDCIDNLHLIGVVLVYEVILRVLLHFNKDTEGKPKHPLLAPAFYLAITPTFYAALWILGVDREDAAEYFFPALNACSTTSDCDEHDSSFLSSVFDESLFDLWRIVQFSSISWAAVTKSVPTLISLVAFSLIHVPINIPAFALSMNEEPDMNAELIAHGYSNAVSGLFAGLQNYMCYANSVIYSKAGGNGRASSMAVVGLTVVFFIFGPTIASYVPRCMAGTLLLHVGIDLLLEGVYDSYGDFDSVEYGGIWLITIVMVVFGMSAALIAGAIAALSTYAFQSAAYQNPIRGTMTAETLRSSAWNRPLEADALLQNNITGRKRILVVQLQGHLFFGNVALVTDEIKSTLKSKSGTDEEPLIVILDFTLVIGMDSSAAQSIANLKDAMHKKFNINFAVWVTGRSEGFPCEYNLSRELAERPASDNCQEENRDVFAVVENVAQEDNEPTGLFQKPRVSGISLEGCDSLKRAVLSANMPSNHVCDSLDSALIFSEDVLIALEDPTLLDENDGINYDRRSSSDGSLLEEEQRLALQQLANLCPGATAQDLEDLFSLLKRERYVQNSVLWRQGSSSDCAKLLVSGELVSVLEKEGGMAETVMAGSMIGELGLVNMTDRLSTVECTSGEGAVLYSLGKSEWDTLSSKNPRLARFIDLIVVRYLAHRVQHVSNRIFETRCLPV